MKKIAFLTFICLFISTSINAQDQEIEMKLNFLGYKFMKNGERLNWKELDQATTSVEDANLLIKKARTQRTISNTSAFVGGFLIGIPLGQESANREPTWELAYIGGAISLVSLHLSFRAFNNVNQGIDSYNLAVNKTAQYQFKPEFHVLVNGNGIGLTMGF